jgi:TatD DNase family protein
MLTDTHLHLHFPQYDVDRDDVIRRAIAGGVGLMINIGTDLEDSRKAVQVAETYPEVYAAVGYHPHESRHASRDTLAELEKLTAHPRVVGVGEIGLDYFHNHSPRETQQEILRVFLSWYRRYQKPILLHCREAYEDMLRLLKEEVERPCRGVIHCYSSDSETMFKFLELGFYIAFGGAVTYKKNEVLREACRQCPAERLLVETDAPYLAPQSRRGERNEPLFLVETAEFIAALRDCDPGELFMETTANARRLFGLC